MKIEKKNGMDQFYFGDIVPLQPKEVKHDKGSENLPLFSQEKTDINQEEIFKAERKFKLSKNLSIMQVSTNLYLVADLDFSRQYIGNGRTEKLAKEDAQITINRLLGVK